MKDITERDLGGGRGRFHFPGNGRGQNGQYRSGFASTHDEGRRDIRLEMPPEPEPSRFSDWSSFGISTPQEHPLTVCLVYKTEQSDNIQNQLNVSTTGEIRTERVEMSNSEEVDISPHTEQSREKLGYTYKTCSIEYRGRNPKK